MQISIVALQLAYVMSKERLGRRRLAQQAGLTEMVTRVELERMRSQHLVQFDRSGVAMTHKGERHFAALLDRVCSVRDVRLDSLQLDAVEIAAHLTNVTPSPAWMLRDHAIREGATALILLIYGPAGWAFSHDHEVIRALNPEDSNEIEALFPEAVENDLLLIVSGPTRKLASRGLWEIIRTIGLQTP